MKKLVSLTLAAMLWGASPAAAQLPLSVQRDLIAKEADIAFEAKEFDELPDMFVQYRALGKQLPTRMLRMEASVAVKNNDHAQVLKTLEIYFKTAKPDDDFYKVALKNYAKHKKLLNAPKVAPKPEPILHDGVPSDVQKDLLNRKIIKAATDKNDPALLAAFTKYRAHGFKLPPRFIFTEAEAAYKTNDIVRAKRVLQEYFATGNKTKGLYSSALGLFEKIEAAETGVANPQQVSDKPKKDAKSDALYADALRADTAKNHQDVMTTLEAFFEKADVEHPKYNSALLLYEKHEIAMVEKTRVMEKYGRKRWAKSYGAAGEQGIRSMVLDGRGGAWLGGSASESKYSGYKIVHINADGKPILNQTLKIAEDYTDLAQFGALALDSTGGIYVSGTESLTKANISVFRNLLVSLNDDGSVKWDVHAMSEHTFDKDDVVSVIVVSGSDVLVGGTKGSYYKHSHDSNFFVARVRNGERLWAKTFGGPKQDGLGAMVATKDGGILLGGYKDDDYKKMFALQLDGDGNVLWSKTYMPEFAQSFINTVAAYPNGGALLGGGIEQDTFNTATVLRVDENGKRKWGRALGEGFITAMAVVPDGGSLVAGRRNAAKDHHNMYLARLDANGEVLWEKTFEASERSSIKSLVLTKDGGALLGCVTELRGDKKYNMYLIRVDNVVAAPPR